MNVRILITGFEPFTTGRGLRLECNPTADIARRVASAVPGAECSVLPVSFVATRASLEALFEDTQPTHWLGLGYAPHREQVDVEMVALNLEHAPSGDNDGDRPNMRTLITDGPVALRSPMNLEAALERFQAHGIEAQGSLHAGAFLCNQVFYLGCHRVSRVDSMVMAGFIHVPPMDDFASFDAALIDILRSYLSASQVSQQSASSVQSATKE